MNGTGAAAHLSRSTKYTLPKIAVYATRTHARTPQPLIVAEEEADEQILPQRHTPSQPLPRANPPIAQIILERARGAPGEKRGSSPMTRQPIAARR